MKFLQVEQSSGVPIYVQLKEKIKYGIASGAFQPEGRLPTVRSLAVALKINVNTVSKVYSELEKEGILETKQGRGTFVRTVPASSARMLDDRIKHLAEYLVVQAYQLGLTADELLKQLETYLTKMQGGDKI